MPAASARTPITALPGALRPTLRESMNPRQIVTLLRPGAIVEKLQSLGLLHEWLIVVEGISHRFDVGVSVPIPQRVTYRNHGSSERVGPGRPLSTAMRI